MSTAKMYRIMALLLLAAFALVVPQVALAAGTASNTSISNTASVQYSVGLVSQPSITSTPVSFLVDNKVNLSVVIQNAAYVQVSPNSTGGTGVNVVAFEVTNNGNTTQDFSLQAIQAGIADPFGGSDNFDATGVIVRVENNAGCGAETYNSATDTGTYIDELAADQCRIVYVISDIGNRANGDIAAVALVATAGDGGGVGAEGGATTETGGADNPAAVDVVFADAANANVAADTLRDGEASDRGAYQVASAVLSISKTATTIWDPLNGNSNPKAIPGALIRYVVTISNAAGATASATLTQVTDGLVATLAIDPDLKVPAACGAPPCALAGLANENGAGDGFKVVQPAGRTDPDTSYYSTASDADGVEFVSPNMTADMATVLPIDAGGGGYTAGELKPGESVTITFNAVVQ